MRLLEPVLERNGLPGAVASLVCGDIDVGKEIVGSKDVDMSKCSGPVQVRTLLTGYSVSFTGSERVGKEVGKIVQDRFGKVSRECSCSSRKLTVSRLSSSSVATMVGTCGDRYEATLITAQP